MKVFGSILSPPSLCRSCMSPDNASAFAWLLVGAASWSIFGGTPPLPTIGGEHSCDTQLREIVDLGKALSCYQWLVAALTSLITLLLAGCLASAELCSSCAWSRFNSGRRAVPRPVTARSAGADHGSVLAHLAAAEVRR